MKTKLVLWGTSNQNDRVLLALHLRANDNKVTIYVIPDKQVTEDLQTKLFGDWRSGHTDIAFPEGTTTIERDMSVAENILPEQLQVERPDVINRAQSEWHFVVLSSKLNEQYRSELAEIEDKIAQLSEYSGEVWDNLKTFWSKVQDQVRERNLFREHADVLRDTTNELFDRLKSMRSTVPNEFEEISKNLFQKFNSAIDIIERKIGEGLQRLPDLFEELKRTQGEFRDARMMREHSGEIWQRIDNAFKTIKEKRFGDNAINDRSALERIQRRYDGLMEAIDKMEQSISRDREELEFQQKKAAQSEGQLEAQIRQAKINMISERVLSKEDKLAEMNVTKGELETKILMLKERDARAQRNNNTNGNTNGTTNNNNKETATTTETPSVVVAPTPAPVVEAPKAAETIATVVAPVVEAPKAVVAEETIAAVASRVEEIEDDLKW